MVRGHHKKDEKGDNENHKSVIGRCSFNCKRKKLTPDTNKNYSVGDLITGYGVSESILHYYNIYGGHVKGKRVIVQGWGNVAGAAAFYLSQAGAIIVGIIDKLGGVIKKEGYTFKEIKSLSK